MEGPFPTESYFALNKKRDVNYINIEQIFESFLDKDNDVFGLEQGTLKIIYNWLSF